MIVKCKLVNNGNIFCLNIIKGFKFLLNFEFLVFIDLIIISFNNFFCRNINFYLLMFCLGSILII